MFQSLIGTIKTLALFGLLKVDRMFQPLIGKIKTYLPARSGGVFKNVSTPYRDDKNTNGLFEAFKFYCKFQSLIGTIKTGFIAYP